MLLAEEYKYIAAFRRYLQTSLKMIPDEVFEISETQETQHIPYIFTSSIQTPSNLLAILLPLLNISSENSIKYAFNNLCVFVEAYAIQNMVVIKFIDSSKGIPSEHLEKIFEPFYRVSKKSSRARGSSGLGLSIVRQLVDRMEGEIKLESKVGSGSTFTVVLPLVPGNGGKPICTQEGSL